VLDTRRCVLLDQLGIGGVGNIRDADRARAFLNLRFFDLA
jgi:hypothetical protein